MSAKRAGAVNIFCLASFFKGADFVRECAAQGARVFLFTAERTLGEAWPREEIEAVIPVPDEAPRATYVRAVTDLARRHRPARVVALEEFDVMTAAETREHLCVPGAGTSAARAFRDKLTMRARVQAAGLRVPPFVHALNYEEVRAYMNRVPPPWVLKPRGDVSAIGIRKLDETEQVWRAIDALDARPGPDERAPAHLLERFIKGDVYHVDSLANEGEVVFAWASRYGRPPMDVAHGGGAFVSYTVAHDSEEERALLEFNRRLLTKLGLANGAAHAEFIRGARDGEFYFLEVASRVGGALTAENVEAGSGVNLWREWAKIELAAATGSAYALPPARREYGGLVLSLARQEHPDTSAYDDPEIVLRVDKPYHAGLVVRAQEQTRVSELLDAYARRFAEDFVAVAPPRERAR